MGKSEDGYSAAFIPEIDEISADAVSYQWEKVEGPGNVFFDEPTSRNQLFTLIYQVLTL